MKDDFIYLDMKNGIHQDVLVPKGNKLVRDYEAEERYDNQRIELYNTEITFFKNNNLFEDNSPVWKTSLLETVIRYSDFNILGKAFLDSGAVEKWMNAYSAQCNRNLDKEIKPSLEKLQKRFDKFMAERNLN